MAVTQALTRTGMARSRELDTWIRTPHEGLVQTVDELTRRFVLDKSDAPVIPGKPTQFGGCGYDTYSQMQIKMTKLAYGCHACKNIVLGPPRIEAKPDLKTLEFYCIIPKCNTLLEKRSVM